MVLLALTWSAPADPIMVALPLTDHGAAGAPSGENLVLKKLAQEVGKLDLTWSRSNGCFLTAKVAATSQHLTK